MARSADRRPGGAIGERRARLNCQRVRAPDLLGLRDETRNYETKIGPRNGASVVARAWSDPTFKEWLLRDATAAIASMDYMGRQGEHMKVVENTPAVHHLTSIPCASKRVSCGASKLTAKAPFWSTSGRTTWNRPDDVGRNSDRAAPWACARRDQSRLQGTMAGRGVCSRLCGSRKPATSPGRSGPRC
jgi:hypothetical protein